MLQIEAVIQQFKLSEVRSALEAMGIEDFMESPVLCHTHQRQPPLSFRGARFGANIVEKVKLEVVVADEAAEKIAAAIGAIARTGDREDCRIAIRPYREVV